MANFKLNNPFREKRSGFLLNILEENTPTSSTKQENVESYSNDKISAKQELITTGQKQEENLYNQQIEKLIDMALADGELTEKEKQVLFKKAEAMGIDLDEFEMVLDARLYNKVQNMKQQNIGGQLQQAAPQSNKFGDIKKCPSCGAMIQSFSTHCPDCGFEFRNVEANCSVQRLFEMLNDVQNSRTSVIASFLDDDKISKKRLIIQNFPAPNTKDDILEFLTLAVPLSKKKGNFFTANNTENYEHNEMVSTWKTKCEQIIMKAKFSMKDDKETLAEILKYAEVLNIK